MINMKSLALFSHLMVIELCVVVCDQHFRKLEMAYDVFPKERNYFVGGYFARASASTQLVK
jgi:hypothetical protein